MQFINYDASNNNFMNIKGTKYEAQLLNTPGVNNSIILFYI